jgi:riboflavin biosynthesis pyrimidine reductase
MQPFQILFDHGEPAPVEHPASKPYGALGFPPPPANRPWIYSNFVQTLDGIVSLRGKHASGFAISQSAEDRWLMDLLRAHADAILLGSTTLLDETLTGTLARGPVFRIMAPELRDLRQSLGRRREKNIFVTGTGRIDLDAFRVFDGEYVDAIILTTSQAASRLAPAAEKRGVRLLIAGDGNTVDLNLAAGLLHRELGIRYLLCEGGPLLYGNLNRAGLIDEKFVTVSPVEVGQVIPSAQEKTESELLREAHLRPTTFSGEGFTKESAPWWNWISCRRVGDHQFSRYRRIRKAEGMKNQG